MMKNDDVATNDAQNMPGTELTSYKHYLNYSSKQLHLANERPTHGVQELKTQTQVSPVPQPTLLTTLLCHLPWQGWEAQKGWQRGFWRNEMSSAKGQREGCAAAALEFPSRRDLGWKSFWREGTALRRTCLKRCSWRRHTDPAQRK